MDDYPAGLSSVTSRRRPPATGVACPLDSPKGFESRSRLRLRLRLALAALRRRSSPGRWLSAVAMLSLAATIATAQPVSTPPGDPPENEREHAERGDSRRDERNGQASPTVEVTDEFAGDSATLTVTGIVRGSDGKPLPGANVALQMRPVTPPFVDSPTSGNRSLSGAMPAPFLSWSPRQRDILARTTTDFQGRYAFRRIRVPPRMQDNLNVLRNEMPGANVVAWSKGHAIQWESLRTLAPSRVDLRLQPEADVRGRLVDENGKPLGRVRLEVHQLAPRYEISRSSDLDYKQTQPVAMQLVGSRICPTITTNNQGEFRLPHLPAEHIICVGCEGPQGHRQYMIVDTCQTPHPLDHFDIAGQSYPVQRSPLQVVAPRLPTLRVKVVDDSGQAVSGGRVTAFTRLRRGMTHSTVETAEVQASGDAIVIVSHAGEYEVLYESDPLHPRVGVLARSVHIPEQGGDVTLKLPKTKTATGRVVEAATDVGVPGVYLRIRFDTRSSPPEPRPVGIVTVSNLNGEFPVPYVEGAASMEIIQPVDGFKPPVRSRMTTADTYVDPAVLRFTKAGPTKPIRVHLSAGLSLDGVVRSNDGKPVAGACVRAIDGGWPTGAVTDEKGRFRLTGLNPKNDVAVFAFEGGRLGRKVVPGTGQSTWETRREELELTLQPGANIVGRVVRDGRPMEGVPVALHVGARQSLGQLYVKVATCRTDSDGHYEFGGLSNGDTYHLAVEPQDSTRVRSWSYQYPTLHRVRVESGDTIHVTDAELVTSEQQLGGIVVDPDGKGISGVRILAHLATGKLITQPPVWTFTDDQGRFTLSSLPDKPIELFASFPNSKGGYPARIKPPRNADDIRMILDPKLHTKIEDLDGDK